MKDYRIKKSIGIDYERLKDLRLYAFFSFAFWPFIVIVALFAFIYTLLKGILSISQRKVSEAFSYLPYTILPFYLIKLVIEERVFTAFLSVVLLLPFMVATILGAFILLFLGDSSVNYGVPQPPSLYQLFSDSGVGLFGTNGEGIKIERLIFIGAGHIYLTSLIAVVIVLIFGLWLGKLTFSKRAEFNIMGFIETVETIPILFLLLVILAVFGWWTKEWKNLGDFVQLCEYIMLTIIVSFVISLGFLPRMIRLIRERIKTFVSENFVDGLKAHGIDQNRILWFHIIKKNCMGDIMITTTQIWGAIILILISMDYLVSIFPLLGAESYSSWARILLTPETKKAILFLKELKFNEWWLYVFPIFFIVTTVTGFYLFGDSLKTIYERNLIRGENRATELDYMFQDIATKIGI